MTETHAAKQLIDMLKTATSPFHTIDYAMKLFNTHGFEALDFKSTWTLTPGSSYYCRTFSGELFAFKLGEILNLDSGIRLAAAHTDWPCLKVKPAPTFEKQGYLQANVEVYGGPILNTYLDRPLSLAGKVAVRSHNLLVPDVEYIDLQRPIAIIPNLAIHLNKKVNEGVELDKQLHLIPITGLLLDRLNEGDALINAIADCACVQPEDILDYELYFYNTDEPQLVGLSEEFLSAPRLDDITGVSSAIHGLIDCTPGEALSFCALFDNEEIGSRTKQGADSSTMTAVIEKIWDSFGRSVTQCHTDIHGSMILSVDVGHGYHPNYGSTSDITNLPILGNGFLLKTDSNQGYAWDCEASGAVLQICDAFQIPVQRYAKRSNLAGGSTIGSMMSSRLPLKTADIGIPMLGMHSARELMAVKDQQALQSFIKTFYSL